MNNICFHFQINQPFRLRTYRFFDINKNHDYFDDYQNHYITQRIAERCYLPVTKMMFELIKKHPSFKFSLSLSGSAILLFKNYCPELIDHLKNLLSTGNVELTGSTYTHSLACLHSKETFLEQIKLQEALLQDTFGIQPVSFCNTGLLYSDEIGEWLGDVGYRVILTEGARHILGWKSPQHLYCNPYQTDVRLLLRSFRLCDDVTLRFNDHGWDQYPLTADKYLQFIEQSTQNNDPAFVNLFWDYETIGEHYTKETGIFDFFHALIEQLANKSDYTFITPNEINRQDAPVSTLHAPWPISYSGEEKDTNEWIGNVLQKEAFQQLYKLEELYLQSTNENAKQHWLQLQSAEHFNFMSSQWITQRSVYKNLEVYPSPYQAFINYMNVLNDIKIQLEKGI